MTMNLDPNTYPHEGDIQTPAVLATPTPLEVYTPAWWVRRLIAKLRDRAKLADAYQEFFDGKQPLAFASTEFEKAFGARYANLPANFMPRVVDAERERLIVQAFRFGGTQPDKSAWRIWQDNQMDAESQIAHEIALVKGVAYAAVDPFAKAATITIEDPCEMVVETAPGNRRTRLAALKVWADDDGYMRAYLYLPDWIYKYRSVNRRTVGGGWETLSWQPYQEADDADWPLVNPLGVVPVVPLLNRPQRDGTGRSEIASVIGNQNAINFLRFSALIGSDVAALPQRWAKNLDLPIDPSTGQAMTPFKVGKHTLWATRRPTADEIEEAGGIENIPPTDFGQFPAADLNPFVQLIRQELEEMSTISGTPYYQLAPQPTAVAPSGEAIKSSEAALVKKTRAATVHFGEGWEETMRIALVVSGQTGKARTDGETKWSDLETRNEAAHTDSVLKQYTTGLLPDDFALEELGYSPQQIERIAELKQAPAPQRIEAAAVLIRAGFEPQDALRTVGLDPVKHLGFLPITVKEARQAPVTDPIS